MWAGTAPKSDLYLQGVDLLECLGQGVCRFSTLGCGEGGSVECCGRQVKLQALVGSSSILAAVQSSLEGGSEVPLCSSSHTLPQALGWESVLQAG